MMSRSMPAMVGRPHMPKVASSSSRSISRLGIVLSGFDLAGRIFGWYLGGAGRLPRLVGLRRSNSGNPTSSMNRWSFLLCFAERISD